jgi:hypothetical protein
MNKRKHLGPLGGPETMEWIPCEIPVLERSLRLSAVPGPGQRNQEENSFQIPDKIAFPRQPLRIPGRLTANCPILLEMRTKAAKSVHSGELTLVGQIRSRASLLASGRVRLGIGDDCALLRPRPGEELAITTDLSIAGRHFQLDWHPPESVGHRSLARGLSDLAAMGARPIAAFLSLGLPSALTTATGRRPAWFQRFFDGLLALAEIYRTPLAGGDLAESPTAPVRTPATPSTSPAALAEPPLASTASKHSPPPAKTPPVRRQSRQS